jgi:hypothetical protein
MIGLSEDRFHATAFMIWLAVVHLWLAATVLKGRRERFVSGVIASGMTAVLVLNVLNPDARIARTNLDRLNQGKRFDVTYVAFLSGDAVPALAAAVKALPEADRCIAGRRLIERWQRERIADWRALNLSRMRAVRAVQRHAREWDLTGCARLRAQQRLSGSAPRRQP